MFFGGNVARLIGYIVLILVVAIIAVSQIIWPTFVNKNLPLFWFFKSRKIQKEIRKLEDQKFEKELKDYVAKEQANVDPNSQLSQSTGQLQTTDQSSETKHG